MGGCPWEEHAQQKQWLRGHKENVDKAESTVHMQNFAVFANVMFQTLPLYFNSKDTVQQAPLCNSDAIYCAMLLFCASTCFFFSSRPPAAANNINFLIVVDSLTSFMIGWLVYSITDEVKEGMMETGVVISVYFMIAAHSGVCLQFLLYSFSKWIFSDGAGQLWLK